VFTFLSQLLSCIVHFQMLPFMQEVQPVDLTLLEHNNLPPRYFYINNHNRYARCSCCSQWSFNQARSILCVSIRKNRKSLWFRQPVTKFGNRQRCSVKKKCGNVPKKFIFNSTSNSFLSKFFFMNYSLSLHYKRKHEKRGSAIPTPSRPTTPLVTCRSASVNTPVDWLTVDLP